MWPDFGSDTGAFGVTEVRADFLDSVWTTEGAGVGEDFEEGLATRRALLTD
jgi:hypothetical protein